MTWSLHEALRHVEQLKTFPIPDELQRILLVVLEDLSMIEGAQQRFANCGALICYRWRSVWFSGEQTYNNSQ